MMSPTEISALVLAAGQATRMKRFKPLLPIDGCPLIERLIGNIRDAGIEEIRVVIGFQAERIIPILDDIGVLWVNNPNFQQEMFSSIKAGIGQIGSGIRGVFIHPGDMPFVQPRTYQALISAYDPDRWDMTRPRYDEKVGHPVLISASRIRSILAYSGSGGLRSLVKQQDWNIYDLECNDPGILIDLDKPEDYESYSNSSALGY